MANPYKKIVLLKGLECVNDYHFKMIKSLLAKELKLSRKVQENCDRIKIADLMEDKFKPDSGLSKLIEVLKDIVELEDLADTLKKERAKVQRKSRGREPTSEQTTDGGETSGAQSTPARNAKSQSKKGKAKAIKSEVSESVPEQSQHPKPSTSGIQQTGGSSETPVPLPPPPSPSNSSTKQPNAVPSVSGINEQGETNSHPPAVKAKRKTTKMKAGEQNLQAPKGGQFPETSAISTPAAQAQPQIPPNLPPLPPSSSTAQQKIVKLEDWEENLLSKRKIWLAGMTAANMHSPQAQPQTPASLPPSTPSSSTAKKPRMRGIPKEPSSVAEGLHREPKEVMVLKVTPLFEYENSRTMFHATVATEREFFRVKVFEARLRQTMFIPNKVIILSEYFGRNGYLEIFNLSRVCPGQPERTLNIPPSMKQHACATPKIRDLCALPAGKFVNGNFLVHKKIVRRNELVHYEIQDNTGTMEVVVFGRLAGVNCEEGDTIKLIGFELALNMDKRQLRSVLHSYVEVTKAGKRKTQPPDSNNDTSKESSYCISRYPTGYPTGYLEASSNK